MTAAAPAGADGRRGWEQLLADPSGALLGFDFDGTLSPIVADPDQAYVHADVPPVLARLGRVVGTVAVITGRPVRTVLRLGSFAETPALPTLVILGQYGVERWDAATGDVVAPPPPPGVAGVREALPTLLAEMGLADARIEDKGRAVAVHVRGLADPDAALGRLRDPVTRLAADHGLVVEPGRMVLEVRGGDMDKGRALRSLVAERRPSTVVYAGDDLGDLAAFDVVAQLRAEGVAGLLICSASTEQDALSGRADIVVPGPDGLVRWLEALADRLGV